MEYFHIFLNSFWIYVLSLNNHLFTENIKVAHIDYIRNFYRLTVYYYLGTHNIIRSLFTLPIPFLKGHFIPRIFYSFLEHEMLT